MRLRNAGVAAWFLLIASAAGGAWAQESAESETASQAEAQAASPPESTAGEPGEPAPEIVQETVPVDAAAIQPAPAAESEPTLLDEVVVTARRKLESLQDVPVAVSAMSAREMESLQVNDFGDVGRTMPNLVVQRQFGSSSAPFFIVRGVQSGLLAFQVDSGIGLYIDGVYLGRPAGAAFDIADLDRLEVMRGPQGTLFGRNSTGGAINFVTAGPSGVFDGKLQTTFADFGTKRGKLTLNLPEVGGLRTRLTAFHTGYDGYTDREGAGNTYEFTAPFGTLSPASEFGLEETNAAGVALSYGGIDYLSVDYRFDYTDKRSAQLAVQALATYPSGGLTPQQLTALFGVSGWDRISLERFDAVPSDTGESALDVMGHSLTAEYEFNEHFSIKNIAADRQFDETIGFNDIDGNDLRTSSGNPFAFISSAQVREQSQWSDELQFLGGTEAFDWIVGLYAFEEEGSDDNPVFIDWEYPSGQTYRPGEDNGSFLAGAGIHDYTAGFSGAIENASYAAFAHGTYRLADDWDVSAGARWTRDTRKEVIVKKGTIENQSFEYESSEPVWDVSVTHRFTPDTSVYGKVATGYLSGGVYGGNPFGAETMISYEIGSKNDLFDRHLRLNAAAFLAEREHLQLAGFTIERGLFIVDAGSATEEGFEIEAALVPPFLEDLSLAANYGYVRNELQNGVRTLWPDQNLYVSTEYRVATFEALGDLLARADLEWRSDSYASPCPVGTTIDPRNGCQNLQQAQHEIDQAVIMRGSKRVGARLSLAGMRLWDGASGSLSLWGRNLLDEGNFEFVRDLGNGLVVGNFEAQRTIGADLTIEFN